LKFSQAFIPTLKEAPLEATIKSHALMIRAGLIRKISSGLYAYLPYGLKLIKNIKQIVRIEMNKKGALEFTMPLLIPKNILDKSGRWNLFQKELFRLKDRHQNSLALSPTNEENFTQLIFEEISSYRQLPVNFYQIHYKFRDEIRPRYGVLRSKEFIMKDSYSFHIDDTCLNETYLKMKDAYQQIFQKCGLNFVGVEADSGAMGGGMSEEFMVKSEVGEEFIIYCECGYAANLETATEKIIYKISSKKNTNSPTIKKIATPDIKTIPQLVTYLKIPIEKCIKTLVYEIQKGENWQPIIVLIRGDYEVNTAKLTHQIQNIGGNEFRIADAKTIAILFGDKNKAGSLGIKNLKKNTLLLVDISLKNIQESVMGANQEGYHYHNLNLDYELKNLNFKQCDLYTVKKNSLCVCCEKPLSLIKGIEVGHIFKLGKKYTTAFNLKIIDKKGEEIIPTMGCYGIGITRVLAACIEQLSDTNGLILPFNIAPYKIIIITLHPEDKHVMEISQQFYQELLDNNFSPLWDERKKRAGFKFKDAELIGFPLQLIIGKKSLLKKEFEIRIRTIQKKHKKFIIPIEQVINFLKEQREKLCN
jgi:prolyl-tRNA synthetase